MRTKKGVSVADAKREFSDLLGRVAYGRETIVITRRGRPMAKLVPIESVAGEQETSAAHRGWLEPDDPFFQIIDQIVSERQRHKPRVLAAIRRRRVSRGRRR
jgi:prevent-host-death family protein